MIEIINKPLLLHLVGYLYYWQMGFNSVFKGLKHTSRASSTLMIEQKSPASPAAQPAATRRQNRKTGSTFAI